MKIIFVVALIFTALLVTQSSQALTGPAFVRIFSTPLKETSEGRDPGDRFVSLSILNDRWGRVIGHSSLVCIRSFTNLSNCTATYVLPRGKIMVQGTRHSRDFYILAVVGGTNLFSNVGGVLAARIIGGETQRLLFSLEP